MGSEKRYNLDGIGDNVELGKVGPRVKANGAVIEHRDSGDANFAVVRGAPPVDNNDLVTKQFLETFGLPTVYGNIYDVGAGVPGSTQFVGAGQEGLIAVCNEAAGAFLKNELYRLDTWNVDVATSSWTTITPNDGLKFSMLQDSANGVDTYLDGHVYLYKLDTLEWIDLGPGAVTSGDVKAFHVPFTWNGPAVIPIGTVPAGAYITDVMIDITTLFDAAPTLDIGVAATPAKYMPDVEIDLMHVTRSLKAQYDTDPDDDLIGSIVPGAATQGAGNIIVKYICP